MQIPTRRSVLRCFIIRIANHLHYHYHSYMRPCDSITLLRSRGLRVTRKKTAILHEVIRSDHPLNAAEIYERVSASLTVDLATVYRTLGSLLNHGLIREISDNSDTLFYEIACVHNPVHPHFKCLRCRKLTCLDALSGESAADVTRYAGDCDIMDISITLSGICRECKAGEYS